MTVNAKQNGPFPLPNDWCWVTLKDLAEIRNGVTKGRDLTRFETVDVPYLRVANVQNGYLNLEEVKHIQIKRTELEKYKLRRNDILFTEGGDRDKLGRGTVWNGEIDSCVHQNHIHCARLLAANVEPMWVSLASQLPYARDYFWGVASQSVNLASLNASNLKNLPIPLPPLDEQRTILKMLEEINQQINTARTALARIPALLKAFRQAVLAAAFRGELTERDPDDEPANILLESIRGERRCKWEEGLRSRGKDPMKAEYLEPAPVNADKLPVLPEGWVWTRVADIADVRLGRQRSPARATGPNMRPYIRAANVTWDGWDFSDVKEMDFTPEEQKVYDLRAGDILLNEASGSVSEVGKPAIWHGEISDCYFQNTLIRVRSLGPDPEYLYFHFYSDALAVRFSQSTQGIGINHLGANGLSEWIIALPPLEEQKRVVDKLKLCFSEIKKIERVRHVARERLDTLEQVLLGKAFRGEF